MNRIFRIFSLAIGFAFWTSLVGAEATVADDTYIQQHLKPSDWKLFQGARKSVNEWIKANQAPDPESRGQSLKDMTSLMKKNEVHSSEKPALAQAFNLKSEQVLYAWKIGFVRIVIDFQNHVHMALKNDETAARSPASVSVSAYMPMAWTVED